MRRRGGRERGVRGVVLQRHEDAGGAEGAPRGEGGRGSGLWRHVVVEVQGVGGDLEAEGREGVAVIYRGRVGPLAFGGHCRKVFNSSRG